MSDGTSCYSDAIMNFPSIVLPRTFLNLRIINALFCSFPWMLIIHTAILARSFQPIALALAVKIG
ncbi:MAG: hypothetical protein CM1200mP4_0140 [Rhodospirillaceae bacterium]|nr:MAG: hypothetical protein CM1200mP4_0140 [Rhodospirillaceae bacterium]